MSLKLTQSEGILYMCTSRRTVCDNYFITGVYNICSVA